MRMPMGNVLGRFMLFLAAVSNGIIYFVDATSGDDANDGKSLATPWKTVAKVNAAALVGDDLVVFKRGETWSGTILAPSVSGTPGHPI